MNVVLAGMGIPLFAGSIGYETSRFMRRMIEAKRWSNFRVSPFSAFPLTSTAMYAHR